MAALWILSGLFIGAILFMVIGEIVTGRIVAKERANWECDVRGDVCVKHQQPASVCRYEEGV